MKRADVSGPQAVAPVGDRPTSPIPVLHRPGVRPARRLRRPLFSEAWRWFGVVVLFLLVASGALGFSLVGAIYWQARTNQARPVDAIVVLGASQYDGKPSAVLRARLDATLAAYKAGYAPVVIVTGGKLEGDRFTEAETCRIFLETHGVPKGAILMEDVGRTTAESMDGVAALMRAHDLHTALFVSDGFHLLRTKYLAKQRGIVGYGFPAAGSPIKPWSTNELRYVIREAAGVVYAWWTGR